MQLDRARGEQLRTDLGFARFAITSAPYARFRAKGDGVVATLYDSGKLVVQGASPETFVERWLADAPPPVAGPTAKPAAAARVTTHDVHETTTGSDECGKGDYFGPLVVAAVRLTTEEADALAGSNVRDSKMLGDEQCLRLGGALRAKYAHAIAKLDPPAYNATYTRPGQLNDILADLHVQAITQLAKQGERVLVDQFANAKLLERKLASLGVRLEQRTRAESNAAVAAASIIAREEFLRSLKELSEEAGVDLHKGAGDPVDRSARAFVALHGVERLRNVAKLHFKNTQKLAAFRGR